MEKQSRDARGSLRDFLTEGTPEATAERYARLKDAAQTAEFGEYDHNLVVLDTETTGLSYSHDELIQIAAARMEQGAITEWFVTFVDPGQFLTDDIVHLTGISESDLIGAPTPGEALLQLVEFVGDAKIVAHNVDFDRHFVTAHPEGYPLLENQWIDSLDIARIALPRLKSHRLIDIVRAFGAPLSTHRADADVVATCAVIRILFAAIDAMPSALVRQIAELAPVDEWPTAKVFAYFAERAATQELAGACNPANVQEQGFASQPPSSPSRFSIGALRKERVSALKKPVKPDADELCADPLTPLAFPAPEDIDEAFSPHGLVGRLYERYEMRGEQLEMAQAVRSAFESSENLIVEAGTGVGKSMAYLVPAVLTVKQNNIAVGVATKTNALLDQLVYSELPKIAASLGESLTVMPLKGFSHYLCLRKVEKLVRDGLSPREYQGRTLTPAPAMAALLSYVEQTEYDDIDSLKIDYRALPRWQITTTSHDCLRRKCPFYGSSCFVHGARRRAEAADIVVTNHSLLFCDLAAEGGLLPPIRYWVIDEAHGTEAEARRAFSVSLAAEDILMLANRMSASEASRNPFVRAERTVVAGSGSASKAEAGTLFFGLTAKAREEGSLFAASAEEFVAHMKDLLFFDDKRHAKSYETVELWINQEIRDGVTFGVLRDYSRAFSERAGKLILACQNLVSFLEECENAAAVQRDIASVAMTLKDMITAQETIFGTADERYAYSVTLNRKKDRRTERFDALVLNVGEALGETLFERTHAVVFASATITIGESFEPFERALGLNVQGGTRARTLHLDSSFDFDRNMIVYVPCDMPEPNDSAYLSALQDLLIRVHRAQGGSMLTLFTNRREMESCFDEVAPAIKEDGLRLVCQKWGVSVKGLRDDFLVDEHLSLFALKSFWEGFDAPGSTLKGVVIPKLPFAKPSDPLSRERAQRDSAAWRHYDLPAAVIDVKQAVGRLIRTADDKGAIILADKRLITKGYGKIFLRSLPSRNVKVCTCDEIVDSLERFKEESPST